MASLYEPDNDLLWVPKEYQSKLAEYRNAPPQILFLGDSCTQFGNYDEFFLAHLKEQGKTVSVGKLGVGGWSSYQGLRQMQRDVLPLKPKVATIYYGWNDHWLGFGIEDRQIAKLRSPLFTLLEHSRLTQLVVKAAISRIDGPNVNPLRVSEADFRKNLWEIVETAKSAGIIPVLLTAPSSHRVGKEPAYLRQRHLKDLRQLVPLHQRYVEIVREVAKEQGVPLCDLAADFAALPESELVEKDFSKDGIHLTKGPGEGYDKLSQFLISCFAERGILEKL